MKVHGSPGSHRIAIDNALINCLVLVLQAQPVFDSIPTIQGGAIEALAGDEIDAEVVGDVPEVTVIRRQGDLWVKFMVGRRRHCGLSKNMILHDLYNQ